MAFFIYRVQSDGCDKCTAPVTFNNLTAIIIRADALLLMDNLNGAVLRRVYAQIQMYFGIPAELNSAITSG